MAEDSRKQEQEQEKEKVKLIDRIAHFIHTYRKFLWGSVIVVGIILVGVLVSQEFHKKVREESTVRIEEVLKQIEKFRNAEGEEKAKLENTILTELDAIIDAYPRYYAAVRAYDVKAEIAFEKKEYGTAAELWNTLAIKYPKSHLAPIALMSAAVCKEEAGDLEGALKDLKEVDSIYAKSFPEIPHVLFSMGRILETKGSSSEASVYYNRLIDEYPSSSWTKLARNRLIYFKTLQS